LEHLRRRELGEVENECTSYNIIDGLPSLCQKLSELVEI